MYDILGFSGEYLLPLRMPSIEIVLGHDALGAFALIEAHFDKIMENVAKKQWDAVYVLLDGFVMYNFRACPKPMGMDIYLVSIIASVFTEHNGQIYWTRNGSTAYSRSMVLAS